ncbi:Secreted protein OS=Streptomyces glaucescens OX=1907 GN=SGLAU_19755 PE=4 SV=1 [Streptomyces glaucescens]
MPGTAYDPYDPVANIVAACNYAADRYGSIDNVFGAY